MICCVIGRVLAGRRIRLNNYQEDARKQIDVSHTDYQTGWNLVLPARSASLFSFFMTPLRSTICCSSPIGLIAKKERGQRDRALACAVSLCCHVQLRILLILQLLGGVTSF